MSQNPKVLYVEDDELSRMVVDIILRVQMGLSDVIIFEDSQNFEERIDEFPFVPDLILLDIHVKPLTGFDMISILRTHPVFHNCLIVALTASVMNEEVDALRKAGFDSILAKPLNEVTFPELMARIMSGEHIWSVV